MNYWCCLKILISGRHRHSKALKHDVQWRNNICFYLYGLFRDLISCSFFVCMSVHLLVSKILHDYGKCQLKIISLQTLSQTKQTWLSPPPCKYTDEGSLQEHCPRMGDKTRPHVHYLNLRYYNFIITYKYNIIHSPAGKSRRCLSSDFPCDLIWGLYTSTIFQIL